MREFSNLLGERTRVMQHGRREMEHCPSRLTKEHSVSCCNHLAPGGIFEEATFGVCPISTLDGKPLNIGNLKRDIVYSCLA